jgi:hypothetical protein
MGGLPGVPGICPYGVEEDDVHRLTGWFPDNTGGTGGVPGDDGPCPANC